MPAVMSRMVTPTTEGLSSIGLDAAFSASKPTVSQAGVPTPIEIGVWVCVNAESHDHPCSELIPNCSLPIDIQQAPYS